MLSLVYLLHMHLYKHTLYHPHNSCDNVTFKLSARMENPHAERQAVLLERIVKNTVGIHLPIRIAYSDFFLSMIVEMHRDDS
jgi:hypothetical protein